MDADVQRILELYRRTGRGLAQVTPRVVDLPNGRIDVVFTIIEGELGITLPSDWKELLRLYGYGTFGDFLHLYSPFFAPCSMLSQVRATLAADRESATPFLLFPDVGGALPWASTDDGDSLYWITRGAPDAWPVGVYNPRSGHPLDVLERNATDLLAAWLDGEPLSSHLASEPPRCFDPWRERKHVTFKLTGGSGTFAQRLEALIGALAPVEMRRAYGDGEDEHRQVHFVTAGGAWRFTYDTVYGHNIRAAAPSSDFDAMRERIGTATTAMGCTIVREQ